MIEIKNFIDSGGFSVLLFSMDEKNGLSKRNCDPINIKCLYEVMSSMQKQT